MAYSSRSPLLSCSVLHPLVLFYPQSSPPMQSATWQVCRSTSVNKGRFLRIATWLSIESGNWLPLHVGLKLRQCWLQLMLRDGSEQPRLQSCLSYFWPDIPTLSYSWFSFSVGLHGVVACSLFWRLSLGQINDTRGFMDTSHEILRALVWFHLHCMWLCIH